jgi:hypothetical protein
MAAKITLTGRPIGPIVETSQYFRFEMEEGGSPAPPKGLPPASVLTFSVFVAKKAGKKLGFPHVPTQRLLVQGELVADVPLSECPGEIGVIAFKLEVIVPKAQEDTQEEQASIREPDEVKPLEVQEPTATNAEVGTSPEAKGWPDLSPYPVVPLCAIRVPKRFQRTVPNAQRTQQLREAVREHGQLDTPIMVQRDAEGYILQDGYRRYLVAQQLEWEQVPIKMVGN